MEILPRKPAIVVLAVVSFVALYGFGERTPAQDLAPSSRVLILTGSNNHDWRQTTPVLQRLLEKTGKFRVDTTVPPRGLTKDNLQNYDVVLSNWNSFGPNSKLAEDQWTSAVRDAYVEFVREGKGHLTVHAGGSSFYGSWPEYHKITLAFWQLGVTNHGPQHAFKVRVDQPNHPVVAELNAFTTRDELWNKPGIVAGASVLASAFSAQKSNPQGADQWEPAVVAGHFGKGRCVAILLGHDALAIESEPFQTLLTRGAAWAARSMDNR